MTFDPVKLCEELRARGDEWAEADAAEKALERTLKPLLHTIMGKSEGGSVAARESEAYADPQYAAHISALNDATKAASLARVKYETMKTYLDLERSRMASERAANTRI